MSDQNQTKQIVAAILAGHAANRAEKEKASSYVEKYILVLQAMKEKEKEIEAALNGPKPPSTMDLLD